MSQKLEDKLLFKLDKKINTLKYLVWRVRNFIKTREVFYLGEYQSLTKLTSGQAFFLDTRDISLAPSILLNGYWEPWITKVFTRTIKNGMIVVDIGSHAGYYTVLSSSQVGETGKVYAFEANPNVFKILFKNVSVNGFIDSVILENKVVYSHTTKIQFNILQQATGSSSIAVFSDEYKNKYQEKINSIEADTISLDNYFPQSIKVDVVKIDAEGCEPYIIRGMKRIIEDSPTIKIFCEFDKDLISRAGEDAKKFLESLLNLGFKLKKINRSSNLVNTSIEELMKTGREDLFLSRANK